MVLLCIAALQVLSTQEGRRFLQCTSSRHENLKLFSFYPDCSHLTGHWRVCVKDGDTWYSGSDADEFIVASEDTVSSCEMFMFTRTERIDVSVK